MNVILRPLLVWLMLLALPFQGLASASMLPCVPAAASHAKTAAAPGHDHAAMLRALADAGHDRMSTAHAGAGHGDACQDHDGRDRNHGHHGNGSCASCCIGAAMAPAASLPLALARPEFISIPFRPGYLPSVDPVLPERPPRAILA